MLRSECVHRSGAPDACVWRGVPPQLRLEGWNRCEFRENSCPVRSIDFHPGAAAQSIDLFVVRSRRIDGHHYHHSFPLKSSFDVAGKWKDSPFVLARRAPLPKLISERSKCLFIIANDFPRSKMQTRIERECRGKMYGDAVAGEGAILSF